MKIKRFFAADIRQAMRMVKEELGADAVIMSNRSVDGGVEIVAARDFDEQLIHNKLQKQGGEQLPAQETPAQAAKTNELPDFEAEKKHLHIISNRKKTRRLRHHTRTPAAANCRPVRRLCRENPAAQQSANTRGKHR